MSKTNPKVAQACRLLRKHAAPQGLIESFLELVEINDSFADQALRVDVNDLFVEACRRFNFTKPFEDDGRKRSFRAYALPSEHPEHEHDSGSSVFFVKQERPGDLGREQAYRRAYDLYWVGDRNTVAWWGVSRECTEALKEMVDT